MKRWCHKTVSLWQASQRAFHELDRRYPNIFVCNIAIRRTVELIGDDKALLDLAGQANDQAVKLANSDGWKSVSESSAQQLANRGELVIGTWRNPSGHGHTTIVVPGPVDIDYSGPRVMTCGVPGTSARHPGIASRDVYCNIPDQPIWYWRTR